MLTAKFGVLSSIIGHFPSNSLDNSVLGVSRSCIEIRDYSHINPRVQCTEPRAELYAGAAGCTARRCSELFFGFCFLTLFFNSV